MSCSTLFRIPVGGIQKASTRERDGRRKSDGRLLCLLCICSCFLHRPLPISNVLHPHPAHSSSWFRNTATAYQLSTTLFRFSPLFVVTQLKSDGGSSVRCGGGGGGSLKQSEYRRRLFFLTERLVGSGLVTMSSIQQLLQALQVKRSRNGAAAAAAA